MSVDGRETGKGRKKAGDEEGRDRVVSRKGKVREGQKQEEGDGTEDPQPSGELRGLHLRDLGLSWNKTGQA